MLLIKNKTGIKQLDEHHIKLIHINNLLEKDLNNEELGNIFYKLAFYIEDYFTEEELLFKKHSYPNLNLHKIEHKDFITTFKHIRQSFFEGKEDIKSELYSFFSEWLENHIINYDEFAINFLKDKISA